MTHTLDEIIEQYVNDEVHRAEAVPVYYGVWIDGRGWLKLTNNGEVLVDRRSEVASAWAALYGGSGRVLPIDETLSADEQRNVERQLLARQALALRRRHRLRRIVRWRLRRMGRWFRAHAE